LRRSTRTLIPDSDWLQRAKGGITNTSQGRYGFFQASRNTTSGKALLKCRKSVIRQPGTKVE
jgi:hypothetical protein